MNSLVRQKLIEVAKKETLITYQELSNVCKLGLHMQDNPHDRQEIGKIVGEISVYENENKRPLLSAIVVSKLKKNPGIGFYELANDLDLHIDSNKKEEFWITELSKIYKYWQSH